MLPFFLVDSFTTTPFHGNPAGVVLLERGAPAEWMQSVAMEMNQAETAFVHPVEGGFNLRWFTPTVEVDLCGHATLATAHVLWQAGRLAPDRPARFDTRSGWLICTRVPDEITMDFPAKPAEPSDTPAGLLSALGVSEAKVFFNSMDYLLILNTEAAVRGLRPDFTALASVYCRGVIVSAAASGGRDYDFVSRFFAPQSGITEDPVTGSAHCTLGPYWSEVLTKNPVLGYQASPRGGYVAATVMGNRVLLRGQAVTVVAGELKSASSRGSPEQDGFMMCADNAISP